MTHVIEVGDGGVMPPRPNGDQQAANIFMQNSAANSNGNE